MICFQRFDIWLSSLDKQKKTILEIGLKSFIVPKHDNQMSKSWKQIIQHVFETTVKLGIKELLNKELLALRNFLLITNSFIP